MRSRHLGAPLLLCVCLLQACSHLPPPPLAVAPLLRVDDSRSTPRQPLTAPPAPPPRPAPPPMAGMLPLAPSRMEIVQLGPNELRLQYRQAEPLDTTAAAATGQIQIVNGNGVRGMGERVRRLLAQHGLEQAQVVNQRGHYQRSTIIEYLPGQQARAEAMLAALQGQATLLPARTLPAGLAMRLVLGRDNATRLAAALAVPPLRLALARPDVPHFNQE